MNTTLALVLLAAAPGADPSGPLQAAAPVIDLGEVKSGPLVTHTFELKHTGAAGDLSVVGVEAGCGCVKSEISAKTLKPGETVKLTAVVNTLTQREGANGWPVTVRYATTGDRRESALELKLTAKLVREISVTPPLLAVSTTGAVTQTLKVEDRRAKPLTVTKVSTTHPAITASVAKAGSGSQEVSVSVTDELPAGSHDDTVTLHTDDPACPVMQVPVKVYKRGANEVSATPDAATIRFAKGQAEASALVQLRYGGKPVSIAKAECNTPGVTVKHSDGVDTVATVRVVVTAAKAGASGQAEVTVTLAQPAGGRVVLPVSWYEP
jgi:hypothetical protein